MAAMMLAVWGILILYSLRPTLIDSQSFALGLGILSFAILIQIPLDWTKNHSWVWWIIAIGLLILPLILGSVVRGSARWIDIGPVRFQPAEFTRPLLLMSFAGFLQGAAPSMDKLVKAMLVLGIPFALIRAEPDLGSALLLASVWFGVLIQSGINWRYLVFGLVLVIISAPIIWSVLHDYQRERIITFINPTHDTLGAGYNVIQAQIAIGSGKLLGKGFGQGTQSQLRFLPENHTDFIFASLAEEFGFVGSTGVLMLYGVIMIVAIRVVTDPQQSQYHRLIVAGVLMGLATQLFINIGMNLGIMPVTGVTLPLVSYGGSSMISTWISLALVVNAAIRKPKQVLTHIH